MSFKILLAWVSGAAAVQSFTYCPPLDHAYPKPQNYSKTSLVQSTALYLSDTLKDAIAGGNWLGVESLAQESFAINVFSASETDSIFEYYHTGSLDNMTGAKTVTEDSVFRIGSVSKLFTMYALLTLGHEIGLEDRITAYVPELEAFSKQGLGNSSNVIDQVQWSDITVGSLASHLSGIGRDVNAFDYSVVDPEAAESAYGLPQLPASERPNCTVDTETPVCSRAEFFNSLQKRHPVFAPYDTPNYSNTGFAILAYAIENVTGLSYNEAMQTLIFNPLNMTNSVTAAPKNSSNGIVPLAYNWWSADLGFDTPAGGVYTSSKDMTSLLRSIMKSTLLSPTNTRKWLRPSAHTSDLYASVGQPWEIIRTIVNTTSNDQRIVDLYTKQGDVPGYDAMIAIIPDYNVAFSVLTAGNNSEIALLLAELIAETFLPVFEVVGKEQASTTFGGVYKPINDSVNSTFIVTTDDGPGLVITEWVMNGSDIIASYSQDALVGNLIRLYPSGLSESGRIGFRTIAQSTTTRLSIFSQACTTWQALDQEMWGNVGLDDLVFDADELGNVLGVELEAWRTALKKAI